MGNHKSRGSRLDVHKKILGCFFILAFIFVLCRKEVRPLQPDPLIKVYRYGNNTEFNSFSQGEKYNDLAEDGLVQRWMGPRGLSASYGPGKLIPR